MSSSVARLRASIAILSVAGAFGGCATVAVMEPVSATEIALTESRSELYEAADAYCEQSREKGLSTGEASLTGLAGALFGKPDDSRTYAELIGAADRPLAGVLRRIRADAAELASGLVDLNGLARGIVQGGRVSREDVASFERVLIHARQGRESLAAAIASVNQRAATVYDPAVELDVLDKALTRAKAIADELAAARSDASLAARLLVAAG